MAVNKVVYNSNTLIDLTDSTLSNPSDIVSGVTAYTRAGVKVTGTLSFVTYYTGSATPSSSVGSNGDIYLKVGS